MSRRAACVVAAALAGCVPGALALQPGDGGGSDAVDASSEADGRAGPEAGGIAEAAPEASPEAAHEDAPHDALEAAPEAETEAGVCEAACRASNMAAYVVFAGYELNSCGCGIGSPCESVCTMECANPSTLTLASACGSCLNDTASEGSNSTCTVAAGITCVTDSACGPFVACEMKCM